MTASSKSLSRTFEGESLQASYSSIRKKSLEKRKQFKYVKEKSNKRELEHNTHLRKENEKIQEWINDLGIKTNTKVDFGHDTIDSFKNG